MMPPTVRAIAANATQPLGPLSASYELVRGGAACAVVIGARPSTPESPRRPEVADNLTLRRQRGGPITQIGGSHRGQQRWRQSATGGLMAGLAVACAGTSIVVFGPVN